MRTPEQSQNAVAVMSAMTVVIPGPKAAINSLPAWRTVVTSMSAGSATTAVQVWGAGQPTGSSPPRIEAAIPKVAQPGARASPGTRGWLNNLYQQSALAACGCLQRACPGHPVA